MNSIDHSILTWIIFVPALLARSCSRFCRTRGK